MNRRIIHAEGLVLRRALRKVLGGGVHCMWFFPGESAEGQSVPVLRPQASRTSGTRGV
jgi:hypothetical protein